MARACKDHGLMGLYDQILQTRQPWADIQAVPARPTAEQEEWLKQEGFREEKEEEEPDQDAEDGAPKVRAHSSLRSLQALLSMCQ